MNDELKRSLADYRATQTPSAERMAAARSALENRIALGDPGLDVPSDVLRAGDASGVGSGGVGSSSATSGVSKLVGSVLGIGLGVLGMWGVAQRGSSEPRDVPVQTRAPVVDLVAPPVTVTANEPARREVAAVSPVARATDPLARIAPSANSPQKPHAPATTPSSGASESSGLREEMALLSRGQAALQSGNPAGALAAFDEHRRRFATGALSAEGEVKRIVALCELGRSTEARAEAARFAKRHPGSPLSSHALKICEAKHE